MAGSLLVVATLVLGCRELRADKRFCATFLILFLSVTQLVSTLLFLAILPSPPPADLLASSGDAADPAGPFFAAAAAFSLLAVIVAAAWIATLVCRGDLLEAAPGAACAPPAQAPPAQAPSWYNKRARAYRDPATGDRVICSDEYAQRKGLVALDDTA